MGGSRHLLGMLPAAAQDEQVGDRIEILDCRNRLGGNGQDPSGRGRSGAVDADAHELSKQGGPWRDAWTEPRPWKPKLSSMLDRRTISIFLPSAEAATPETEGADINFRAGLIEGLENAHQLGRPANGGGDGEGGAGGA